MNQCIKNVDQLNDMYDYCQLTITNQKLVRLSCQQI